jgi:hypothetical protein
VDTELMLVSGLAEPGVADVVDRLLAAPGTAVAHHDLSDVASGVVRRRLRVSARGGVTESVMHLELAHGCVSCT